MIAEPMNFELLTPVNTDCSGESFNCPLTVPPPRIFPLGDVVEHLLIGSLGAVRVPGAQVFDFDVVKFPDPLIHPGHELLHRRESCGNGVRCPNIRRGDPVKGQAPGFDNFQHLEAVFSVRNPGYVLGAVVDHNDSSVSAIALKNGYA